MNKTLKNFMLYLNKNDVKYEIGGEDTLIIRQGLKNSGIIVSIFIIADSDNSEDISMAVFGLCQTNNITMELLQKINELNYQFRWFKLNFDGNNRLIMRTDFYLRNDKEQHIMEMIIRALTIADDCYPQIMRCLWR